MQKSIYFSELKFNVATEFQTVILCLCFLKRVRKKVLESNEKKKNVNVHTKWYNTKSPNSTTCVNHEKWINYIYLVHNCNCKINGKTTNQQNTIRINRREKNCMCFVHNTYKYKLHATVDRRNESFFLLFRFV